MDFVARAGAIIDRAHRIAGILLICVILLGLVASCQLVRNKNLQDELEAKRIRYPVIVVPDATTGVYSPTEEDRLISLFADFVTQSLNSYTPENITKLYSNLRQFFGPALQADSGPYFQRIQRDAMADRRSSFFVPDRSQPLKVTRRVVNEVEYRDVVMPGQINAIVGGTTAESLPVEINMTFQKGFASPSNPYGFILTAYHVKPLVDTNKAPQVPTQQQ